MSSIPNNLSEKGISKRLKRLEQHVLNDTDPAEVVLEGVGNVKIDGEEVGPDDTINFKTK